MRFQKPIGRWFCALICLTVFVALSSPGAATMVLPLDLRQMTEQSGKIFVGRCETVTQELDEWGFPSTYARLSVLQGIKGVETGESVLIKQFGADRPLTVSEGESAIVTAKSMALSPGAYEPGRDYLLFLYPDSSLGFTSPVGAGQGRYEVLGRPGSSEASALTVAHPLSKAPLELEAMLRRIRSMMRSR